MGLDTIKSFLAEFDVVSFDVFDTLLLRPCLKPSDLFWRIEQEEGAPGFAIDRERAEHKAQKGVRAQGRVEATIDEIYSLIPQWAWLKDKELETENSCLVANPEMLELFGYAKSRGKKILVVSDMYLPADFLKKVLKKNGIEGWDGFYVSSEQQLAKWSGALYDQILSDMGIAARKILHIGDNLNSDVLKANERGIVAYGYQKVIDKFYAEFPFAIKFLKERPSPEKRLFVGSIALGWHLYKCAHSEWSYWNKIGFLFAGSLGYAYMRFVGESSKRLGFEHLMFVARDGYVLQKIFNVLYPGIRTDYFYASRVQALLCAKYFGSTESGIKVRRRYCLKYLEDEMKVELTDEQKDNYESTGKLPASVQGLLDSVADAKKTEAKTYLSKFSIKPSKTAIVDGDSTHFTVQKFVGAIVGHDIFSYYLFTNRQVENAETMACADWNMRYLHFAEFLFGAPTPPLKDVVRGEPEFKDDVLFFEKFKMGVSDEISSGAVFCAEELNKNAVRFNHEMWLDWNDAFMDNLTPVDLEMFSFARNSIAIGHESGYHPVLMPVMATRRLSIFGGTVLSARLKRDGVARYWSLRLFGKIPLLNLKVENAAKMMGAVRSLRRNGWWRK